jgi:hypothetical protein
MGMTDRQFCAYQKRILRDLERIQTQVGKETSKDLDSLIQDLSEELQGVF